MIHMVYFYRSKDELIQLVSEEEFYKEAPESISRPVRKSEMYLLNIITLYLFL